MDVFDISQFKVDIKNGNLANVTSLEGPVEDLYNSTNLPYKFYTDITASLLNNYVWYYDIECKFDLSSTNKDDDWFRAYYDSNSLDKFSEYFDYTSGKTLRIFRGLEDFTGDLWFRIVNKSTGQIVHIKKISLSGSKQSTDINDVTIFDTEEDVNNNNGTSNNTGVNDNTINNFGANDSIIDLLNGQGDVLSTIKNILNMFPSWLTGPILFFLSSLVTIAIIKKLLD